MENNSWKFVLSDDPNGNHHFTLDTSDISQFECDVVRQMVNNEVIVTQYVLLIHTRINICGKKSNCLYKYYENKEDFDRDYNSLVAKFNFNDAPGIGWNLK